MGHVKSNGLIILLLAFSTYSHAKDNERKEQYRLLNTIDALVSNNIFNRAAVEKLLGAHLKEKPEHHVPPAKIYYSANPKHSNFIEIEYRVYSGQDTAELMLWLNKKVCHSIAKILAKYDFSQAAPEMLDMQERQRGVIGAYSTYIKQNKIRLGFRKHSSLANIECLETIIISKSQSPPSSTPSETPSSQ
ncbi:hypothetical protein [Parachitinimonas caeni]|uniref:Uncharacterized protein n=1 Tax=Parachitinimonas caeni TaxID=3031301 RepID=A0ABT7E6N5_9NEIS|nr:hypothetical protein [Parachitinimonas caeni]MDK2127013.1 hypothetical protein [Parachitinimonas caeni]